MIREYFYLVNYQGYEKNLCDMEMKYLLDTNSEGKYLFSNINVIPSRSPFIKHRIEVIFKGKTLDEIICKIKESKLAYEGFKVHYIKSEAGDVEYKERLRAVSEIGFVITGFPDIHNPIINLAVSRVNDNWIFGIYEKNDCKWQEHDKKPHSYSNALSIKMARAIVNIAIAQNLEMKVVDPCCGVGTVVIEALDLGVDIAGFEISKAMACNARNNIEFLGYKRNIITCGDMHEIKGKYNAAIVDIPYGIFSPITVEEQKNIIKTCRRISEKIVLISFEDMDNMLEAAGFNIIDKTSFAKNRFTRHITIAN